MEKMTLHVSGLDLMKLEQNDYKWTTLGDFYLTRIIFAANEAGLKGKKIKEIVGLTSPDDLNHWIDLIVE